MVEEGHAVNKPSQRFFSYSEDGVKAAKINKILISQAQSCQTIVALLMFIT
jgi:hypothetical protein